MAPATRRAVVAAAAAAVSAAGAGASLSSAKGSVGASIPGTLPRATPLAASQVCQDTGMATAVNSETQRTHSPVREPAGISERDAAAIAAAPPAGSFSTRHISESSQKNIPRDAGVRSAAGAVAEEWQCPHCTLINKAAAAQCDACGAARPSRQKDHQVLSRQKDHQEEARNELKRTREHDSKRLAWLDRFAPPARSQAHPRTDEVTPPAARSVSPMPRAWTTPAPAPAPTPAPPPAPMATAAVPAAAATSAATARITAPASTSPARPLVSFFDMLKDLD